MWKRSAGHFGESPRMWAGQGLNPSTRRYQDQRRCLRQAAWTESNKNASLKRRYPQGAEFGSTDKRITE